MPPSVEISNFSDEDVDFIAPAENIKKVSSENLGGEGRWEWKGGWFFNRHDISNIFKIPYSNSELSLVVHKIGRTIVLDKLSKEEAVSPIVFLFNFFLFI